MKKSMILNSKKIIIFILIVIGIILISPMINNIVYAKSGKLPAKITTGLLGLDKRDNITIRLDLSEEKYMRTKGYIENDKYLKNHGYSVLPPITEGTEFWTAQPPSLQLFDDNFLKPQKFKKEFSGAGTITGPPLKAFNFKDLINSQDVYCANKGTLLLQEAEDIGATFGLPPGSILTERLKYFVDKRNEKLGSLNTRGAALSLDAGVAGDYSHLDNYTDSAYPSSGVSTYEMENNFGYIYTGDGPTYPYVIREIDVDSVSNFNLAKLIVKVKGGEQAIDSTDDFNKQALMRWASSEFLKKIFDTALELAIKQELGELYDPDGTLHTEANNYRESVADSKFLIRTNNYFQLASANVELSAQSAYALAMHSGEKPGYPGTAQDILWTILQDQYQDGREFVQYVVYTPEAVEAKTYAEAFEAHYKRLVEWKKKYSGGFGAQFVDTNRSVIFNSASEKYDEGAWLIGPYKLDYLLNTIKYNNNELYFAGMTGMTITGEYNDKNSPIKEIKKWSFFVPIQTSETTLTADQIAAGKITSLKYGVPEPNQEFFIEIPYDENLIRITELRAKFAAIDYKATANYHIGMGEYVDFSLDVAVELIDSMAHKYKDVSGPTKVEFTLEPGKDTGILTLTFDHAIYLTFDGNTAPPFMFEADNQGGWKHESGKDNVIYRIVKWRERNANLNKDGIYYTFRGIHSANGPVVGGDRDTVSFSEPYTGAIIVSEDKFPTFELNFKEYDTYVTIRPNLHAWIHNTSPQVNLNADIQYTYQKKETEQVYTIYTHGGQSAELRIPALIPEDDDDDDDDDDDVEKLTVTRTPIRSKSICC